MRKTEELKKRSEWAIANLQKSYIGDNTINKSNLDELEYIFSINYIDQAIKNGLLTNEELVEKIKKNFILKEEVELCPQ